MGDYILDVPSIAMCSYSKGSEESGLYVSVLSSHAKYFRKKRKESLTCIDIEYHDWVLEVKFLLIVN